MSDLCFFDIETVGLTWDQVDDRIISCSILPSGSDKPEFFIIDSLTEDAEIELIEEILDRLLSFSTIVGFNSDGFDVPFIMERAKRLLPELYDELNVYKYNTFNKQFNTRQTKYIIRDHDFLDYLTLIKFYKNDNLPDHKLNTCSDFYLDDQKIDLAGDLPIKLFNENRIDELHRYNDQDVILLNKLEEKLGLIELSEQLAALTGCKLYQTVTTSKIAEAYFEKKGLVLSDNENNIEPSNCKNLGGLNWQADAGIYHNVSVLDYKSLYPTIILSFNLDPELSPIIKELWDLRSKFKNDKSKYYAIKVILNSFYGYMSYKYSKRYRPQIAAKITEYGREIISWTKSYIEENSQGKVILQDTDSCYVVNNEIDPEIISNAVNNHFKTEYPLELELEAELKSIMLIGRKKYYAYLTNDGEYTYKGIAAVRGNTYPILKKIQIEIINQLLNGETNFRDIDKVIDKRISEASLLDIAIPYNLGKDFTNSRNSFKAESVQWSIENINSISNSNDDFNPELGSKVYILEVKRALDFSVQFDPYIALTFEMLKDDDYWRSKFVPSVSKVSKDVKRIIHELLDSVGADTGKGKQKSLFDWG
jgi:DNA polymerase elongation subunit (family B)